MNPGTIVPVCAAVLLAACRGPELRIGKQVMVIPAPEPAASEPAASEPVQAV